MPSPTDRKKEVLEQLITRSGAITAMLVSKEGYNLTSAGDVSYLNTTALAALVAGMFSATREVAKMVGEKQFSILLQQGKTRNIHISLIGEATMMVVVFEDQQRIGKVRLAAQHAADEVFKLLDATEAGAGKSELGNAHFKEYALQLIDKIFSPS